MLNQKQITQRVWSNPLYFIAFGFGSGLMPIAPGTWGTLAALPLYYLIQNCTLVTYGFLTLISVLAGIWFCDRVSKDMGVHDYKGIVWDEIAGYLITMFMAPKGLLWMIIGFFLFRLFDIWKPQPIKYIDNTVQGGLGIMLDDVLAAIPAWIILQLLAWSFVR